MFETIINFILKREGGYVNNSKDPGGETKYGISKRRYPKEDIKNLTVARAIELYKRDYYDKVVTPEMSFGQAAFMVDTAVNMGEDDSDKFWKESNGDIDQMFSLRSKKYDYFISRNPKLKVFRKGWMNRLTLLRELIDQQ